MTFGDKDVTVRRNDYVIRLKEIFGIASSTGLTEGHEKLAVPAEFENLMSFPRRSCRRISAGASSAGGAGAVRYPNVAVAVHEDPVRRDQHAAAKALDQFSVFIKVENRVEHGVLAGVRPASFGNPDGFTVFIDFDRACGAPRSALGQLRPVRYRLVRIG